MSAATAPRRPPVPVFFVFACCAFASGFALRIVDPIVLPLASHFGVTPAMAAGLNTAYALPYALAQPFLGPLGDRIGKTLLVRICITGLAAMLVLGIFAPTFPLLVAARVAAGIFAGGLIPLVLASIGDAYAMLERQVVIGRMLFAIVGGQMAGSVVSGIVNDRFGWIAALVAAAVVGAVAAILAVIALPRGRADRTERRSVPELYRLIFANPKAGWIYGAVLVEGAAIYGAFPFMSDLLLALTAAGRQTISVETGLVLGSFGVGGLLYAATVRPLLRVFGVRRLCLVGSSAAGIAIASVAIWPIWWLDALALFVVGIAFYMIHSSLQTESTEIAPSARGSASALFACGLFAGQGLGPLLFGPMLHLAGPRVSLLVLGVVLIGLGRVVVAKVIARPLPPPAPAPAPA